MKINANVCALLISLLLIFAAFSCKAAERAVVPSDENDSSMSFASSSVTSSSSIASSSVSSASSSSSSVSSSSASVSSISSSSASVSSISSSSSASSSSSVASSSASSTSSSAWSLFIEAENYTVMQGVSNAVCSEGGQEVGYIDSGDWMVYSLNIPTATNYTISFRVASPNSGKSFSLDYNAGAVQLGTVDVVNTGSWASYTTVTQVISLPAGVINFGINAGTGGFNLNYFSLVKGGVLPPPPASPKSGLNLVWSDEFNTGTQPDTASWSYYYAPIYNNEVQKYTNSIENAYVSAGTLKIAATKSNGIWHSTRLISQNKRDFTYGYLEFSAKLPVKNGMWPALWLMPTDSFYGGWPASGEIDVMEHATSTFGFGKVFATLHTTSGSGAGGASFGNRILATAGSAFHTYAMLWTASKMSWYVDDVKVGEVLNQNIGSTQWPFDKRFHFILNVAVGGDLGGWIDPAITQDIMEVDYVRVYQ